MADYGRHTMRLCGVCITSSYDVVCRLCAANARVAELEARQSELLATIAQLSKDSIDADEADELRGQIASLIADVGTLRSALRALDTDTDTYTGTYAGTDTEGSG